MKHHIATITKGGQRVQVKSVEGLAGYEFDAEGEESLPLAVELAILQTRGGIGEIDMLLQSREGVVRVGK